MVIEHIFVTTLDSKQALGLAASFLQQSGFVAVADSSFQIVGRAWTEIEMQRGKPTATRAKDALECPQRVRLEWDRGRVTVALSITPRPMRSSFRVTGGKKEAARDRLYAGLMTTLATSLEKLLCGNDSPDGLAQEWQEIEADFCQRERADRRRQATRALIIFFGIIFAVILIIVAIILLNR